MLYLHTYSGSQTCLQLSVVCVLYGSTEHHLKTTYKPDIFLFVFQAILGGTIQVPTLTGDVVLKVRIVIAALIL